MDQENIKKRRSIRDIPISGKRNSPISNKKITQDNPVRNAREKIVKNSVINLKSAKSGSEPDTSSEFENKISYSDNYCGPKFNLRKTCFISLVIFVPLLYILFSSIFAKSHIIISLKNTEIQMDSFELDLVLNDLSVINFGLAYKDLTLSKTESLTVQASQEELVRQKASGIITVYNEYSPNDQNWIQNTRFQSPSGLIYRTPNNVTIPGYKMQAGVKIPGQIDIEVFADDFGEKYNFANQTKFTVPAFIGQESFDSFYAISKTNMSGGFDGVRRTVSDSDLQQAKTELRNNLKSKLTEEIKKQIPNNFLAFYLENYFTFDEITQQDGNRDQVILSQNANLNLILVDKIDLAKAIASNLITDYRPNENVIVKNLDELNIKLKNTDSQTLVLSGNAYIEWQVNNNNLINDLLGKKTGDLKDVLINYREITSVTSEISPIWKNSFSNNPRKIKVITKE